MARKEKGKEKAAEKDREDLSIDKEFIEKRKNEILGILIIALPSSVPFPYLPIQPVWLAGN